MFKHILTNTLQHIESTLKNADMTLMLHERKVKHINFRVKVGALNVSYGKHVQKQVLYQAICARLDWAVAAHKRLMQKQNTLYSIHNLYDGVQVPLWGEAYALRLATDTQLKTTETRLRKAQTICDHNSKTITTKAGTQKAMLEALELLYRQELSSQIERLCTTWQPKVNAQAKQVRLKKMTTRWGSCNTQAKRVWLSIYLAKYPPACTDYVMVHELCHLHEANHSPKFWALVTKAMPDYRHWHDYLKTH